MTAGGDKAAAVRLRAMEPEDVEMLYELENDQSLWACGDTTAPYSRATLRRYVAETLNDIYQDRQLRMVIEADAKPVGCADLFSFDPVHRRAEVGIALLPAARGCGIGCQAIRQLSAFVREHLAFTQLYAIVDCTNVAAQSIFLSCGFRQTACLKSWLMRGNKPHDALLYQLLLTHIDHT